MADLQGTMFWSPDGTLLFTSAWLTHAHTHTHTHWRVPDWSRMSTNFVTVREKSPRASHLYFPLFFLFQYASIFHIHDAVLLLLLSGKKMSDSARGYHSLTEPRLSNSFLFMWRFFCFSWMCQIVKHRNGGREERAKEQPEERRDDASGCLLWLIRGRGEEKHSNVANLI